MNKYSRLDDYFGIKWIDREQLIAGELIVGGLIVVIFLFVYIIQRLFIMFMPGDPSLLWLSFKKIVFFI